MIKVLNCNNKNYINKLINFLNLRRVNKKVDNKIVSKIIKDVEKNKFKAVLKYEKRFSKNLEIRLWYFQRDLPPRHAGPGLRGRRLRGDAPRRRVLPVPALGRRGGRPARVAHLRRRQRALRRPAGAAGAARQRPEPERDSPQAALSRSGREEPARHQSEETEEPPDPWLGTSTPASSH